METHNSQACKPTWIKVVDISLYWVLLVLAILANFVISVTLVPILMTTQGLTLYFLIFVIAVTFGFLFSQLLRAIQYLQKTHIIIGALIPAIALINFAILTILSNRLITALELSTAPHNPWIVAVVYVLAYSMPEFLTHQLKRR